jgi:uncharacterized protein with NAD-binding domain and iron-sulfur cluster
MLDSETVAGGHGTGLPTQQRVAVIGGGVSGLSAAHELVKRGFSVTVFERRGHVGGKASSWQEKGLPAEHGFRFFPGFYFHVIETMKDIPEANGPGTVFDHLVELKESVFTDENGRRMTMPLVTRTSRPGLRERLRGAWTFRESMPGPWECACFLGIVARLATTCRTRWEQQLERQSWFDHVMPGHRAGEHSPEFERLFAIGLTRSFVATRAEEMNARTGGSILLQLLYDTFFGPPIRRAADRALDGPTSKVWIDPWYKRLTDLKVDFRLKHEVLGLSVTDGRISGLSHRALAPDHDVDQPESPPAGAPGSSRQSPAAAGTGEPDHRIHLGRVAGEAQLGRPSPPPAEEQFDSYILAVPCEVLKELLASSAEVVRADRSLEGVFSLKTRWMNGIVIGLAGEVDPPMPMGHVLCLGSEWALTMVDQSKFWSAEHLKDVRPRWKTLLSIDISDWNSPGRRGLPAKWPPSRNELRDDLWLQLKSHMPELAQHEAVHYNLDFDIRYDTAADQHELIPIARKRTNDEPLLINTPDSWRNRPQAKTSLRNLFVAGDFAQSATNFASMEAANETARKAVNALLESLGRSDICATRPLEDPQVGWFSAPQRIARRVDALIYRSKLPLRPPFRLPIVAWIVLGVAAKLKRRLG